MSTSPLPRSDRGLQLIIAYKFARGGLALLAGVVLTIWVSRGKSAALHNFADHLSAHWTTGVSSRLADLLQRVVAGRHLWMVVAGLVLDGTFTLVEAVALFRGYSWGPWLVVIATSLLLPIEAVAWVEHPTAGRALLFVLNALVAGYLARRVIKQRERSRAQPT